MERVDEDITFYHSLGREVDRTVIEGNESNMLDPGAIPRRLVRGRWASNSAGEADGGADQWNQVRQQSQDLQREVFQLRLQNETTIEDELESVGTVETKVSAGMSAKWMDFRIEKFSGKIGSGPSFKII